MDRDQIRDQLIGILTSGEFKRLQVDASTLNEDTSLLNEVILDSLQLLDFILAMEQTFGFRAKTTSLNIDIFDRFGGVIDFVQSSLPVTATAAAGGSCGDQTA